MSTRRILIIGGGHPQLTLVEESRRLGLYTIVVDDRKSAPGRGIANEVLDCGRYDTDRILSLAEHLAVDAVVSGGSDRAVSVMTQAAMVCGVEPYVDGEVAALPMNKDSMRDYLAAQGLPAPRAVKVASLGAAREAAAQFGYPVVVKPVDGIGQLGVDRVDSDAGLGGAFQAAINTSQAGTAILQEFAQGEELGVNGFVIDGAFRLLTVAYRSAPRQGGNAFGVALQKRFPVESAAPYYDRIAHILDRACRGLGLRNSPIYAQLMFNEQDPEPIKIIEIMPRLGGGEDPRLVLAATGFNIAKATVLAALGEALDDAVLVESEPNQAVTLRFLTAPEGTIERVDGVDAARRSEGVLGAQVFFPVGHVLGPLRSSRERVGYVLAVGDSPSQADHRAAEAARKIVIRCA